MAFPAIALLALVGIGAAVAIKSSTSKDSGGGGGGGGGGGTKEIVPMTCMDYINAMPIPEAQKQVMRLALTNDKAIPEQLQLVANEIRKQSATFPYAESLAQCFEKRATDLKPS